MNCPEQPILLGEAGVCEVVVRKNTLSTAVGYSVVTKLLDDDMDTSSVISVTMVKDVIPSQFTGKIAEVYVPLDEKMAKALELNDVRDLTPKTNTWVCENGDCHYTLERVDTPHYLKLKIRLDSGEYMNLEGIITARYTGSKYWNEDANGGIKKGALMIIAPLGLAYAPVEYMGTVIVEMTPAPKPVKTIIQVFLFVKSIGQSIWKEINFGG
ncbi:hypothetical protein PAP_07445 [Palaeococcus pacificus DY20341]|uniref:Uncharacterized protein n=1 Tax=Palaeococcus pacificus DY20341 TaxID=1343739 RepID=A0A075LU29_9EURY|nr:hypothetical protein PAP_07445 [Palaeococcus pacificus DY20341]